MLGQQTNLTKHVGSTCTEGVEKVTFD